MRPFGSAKTVAEAGKKDGMLAKVVSEKPTEHGDMQIHLVEEHGTINANLTVGVDVSKAKKIKANEDMAFSGVTVNGSGFIVTPEQAKSLGLETVTGLQKHIRPYLNGRDIMGNSRKLMILDMYGLSIDEVKNRYPNRYRVTCIKMPKYSGKKTFILDNRDGVTKGFTADEVLASIPTMLKLQARRENIYYTPLSDDKHHIIIDDMTAESVARLGKDGFVLAVILESSPNIYAP